MHLQAKPILSNQSLNRMGKAGRIIALPHNFLWAIFDQPWSDFRKVSFIDHGHRFRVGPRRPNSRRLPPLGNFRPSLLDFDLPIRALDKLV